MKFKSNIEIITLNLATLELIEKEKLDSIVIKNQFYTISKNNFSNRFAISDSLKVQRFGDIKDFSILDWGIQFIDNKNEIVNLFTFYNENGYKDKYFTELPNSIELIDLRVRCGTVPHYNLSIKERN